MREVQTDLIISVVLENSSLFNFRKYKKKKMALKKLVIFKNLYLSKQMQKVYDKEEVVHVHKFEDADSNRRNDLFHL